MLISRRLFVRLNQFRIGSVPFFVRMLFRPSKTCFVKCHQKHTFKRFFVKEVGKNVFARTDLGEIDQAKHLFAGFVHCAFSPKKMSQQKVERTCQIIQTSKKLGQKLGQKLQQIPSKNRSIIQYNNPKTGRRALARRVVVSNFCIVFERNLLELLAELLTKFLLAWII